MKNKALHYKNIINKFKGKNILIIGDLMIDKYIIGKVERISPEAPVPVLNSTTEKYILGGATNVANNITTLGGNAFVCGVIGNDGMGRMFKELIQEKNINTDGLIIDNSRPTIVKSRIIANHQQLLRIDTEKTDILDESINNKIIKFLNNKINDIHAVIISDYGKGVVSKNLLERIIDIVNKNNKIISVDPKVKNFFLYKNVTLITPNNLEASQSANINIIDKESLLKAGNFLRQKLNCKNLLITRGEHGMVLFNDNGLIEIPTFAKEVYDVTGAGDTVIATCTMAMTTDADMIDAITISNLAAGIVVGRMGTATVSIDDLQKSIELYYK